MSICLVHTRCAFVHVKIEKQRPPATLTLGNSPGQSALPVGGPRYFQPCWMDGVVVTTRCLTLRLALDPVDVRRPIVERRFIT